MDASQITSNIIVGYGALTEHSDGMRCVTDDSRCVWRMGLC